MNKFITDQKSDSERTQMIFIKLDFLSFNEEKEYFAFKAPNSPSCYIFWPFSYHNQIHIKYFMKTFLWNCKCYLSSLKIHIKFALLSSLPILGYRCVVEYKSLRYSTAFRVHPNCQTLSLATETDIMSEYQHYVRSYIITISTT